MKDLNATLDLMKLPEASQKDRSLGSMTTAGSESTQHRPAGLTESDLTQIASKLLVRPLKFYFSKKRESEEKTASSDEGVEIEIEFRTPINKKLIDTALRHSPSASTADHLKRLALHKNFGSSDDHRMALIHDYAEALRSYSEFVIYMICKYFWESDQDPWRPTIPKMVSVCECFHSSLRAQQQAFIEPPKPKKIPIYQKEDRTDHPVRIDVCKFLTDHGQPDYIECIHTHSNYFLERMASRLGWKKGEANA